MQESSHNYGQHNQHNYQHPRSHSTLETIKSLASTLAIFLLAPLVAIFLTAFVFQSYEVEGQSMERTLQNHDRLIVYKLPKTIANFSRQTYQPKRGEIIVFTKTGVIPGGNKRQ